MSTFHDSVPCIDLTRKVDLPPTGCRPIDYEAIDDLHCTKTEVEVRTATRQIAATQRKFPVLPTCSRV